MIDNKRAHIWKFVQKWLMPNPATIVIVLLLLFTVPSLARRENNGVNSISTSTIPYQGRLASSDGTPITGLENMAFRLYDVPAGGTHLWEEIWMGGTSVAISDGLFSVMLGSLNSDLTAVVQAHNNLYLEVTVGTDPPMEPRVQLGSVPFSIWALSVADGSISTVKLSDDAVTTDKIADGAVGNGDLAADAISTDKIVNGSVETADLANDAVTTDKILAGSVENSDLANGVVTTAKIANNAVGSSEIIDGSVETPDLASGSVTQTIAPSLVLGPVSNTKIAHGQASASRRAIDAWGNVNISLSDYGFTQTPTAICSMAGDSGATWNCHVEYETSNSFTIWVYPINGNTSWSTVAVRWIAVGE